MTRDTPNFRAAGPLRVVQVLAGAFPRRPRESLNLLRLAREVWQADTGIHPFRPRYHTFLLVLSGTCQLRTAQSTAQAGPGFLIGMPAGQERALWVGTGAHLEHYILDIDGEEVTAFCDRHGLRAPAVWPIADPAEAGQVLAAATRRIARQDAQAEVVCRHYLRVFLELAGPRPGGPAEDETGWILYQRIRAWIEEHGAAGTSVQEAARTLEIHPDHLARVFRRYAGETPGVHLRRLRMSQAGLLLATTGRKLEDVAESLGYSDAFAFAKAFKARFGQSPGRWRRQFTRLG